ncbi:MAG: hypothetical protein ACP5L4_06900 [Thermoplasmata archaeon]|jgi:hypothetical protein
MGRKKVEIGNFSIPKNEGKVSSTKKFIGREKNSTFLGLGRNFLKRREKRP